MHYDIFNLLHNVNIILPRAMVWVCINTKERFVPAHSIRFTVMFNLAYRRGSRHIAELVAALVYVSYVWCVICPALQMRVS
jgi:hypothetical protein